MSGDWPIERMTESFAQLCDEAAVAGTRISIEVIAFSNLASLDRTMAVIDGAGRPNGGLLLDIWHLVRGGVSFADVAALPGHVVHGIELNDAAAGVEGSLFEDTVFRRRFCGEGAFDIAGFVDAVRAIGYRGPYGCEVLNDDIRKMPLEAVARLAFQTTAAQLSAGSGSKAPRLAGS